VQLVDPGSRERLPAGRKQGLNAIEERRAVDADPDPGAVGVDAGARRPSDAIELRHARRKSVGELRHHVRQTVHFLASSRWPKFNTPTNIAGIVPRSRGPRGRGAVFDKCRFCCEISKLPTFPSTSTLDGRLSGPETLVVRYSDAGRE